MFIIVIDDVNSIINSIIVIFSKFSKIIKILEILCNSFNNTACFKRLLYVYLTRLISLCINSYLVCYFLDVKLTSPMQILKLLWYKNISYDIH